MKKQIFSFLICLLFLVSIVSAAGNGGATATKQQTQLDATSPADGSQDQLRVRDQEQMKELSEKARPEMFTKEKHEKTETKVTGLHNAILHVDNEQAKEKLQLNMEKFQNRYQYAYEQYDVVDVDGETFIQAKRKAKFLIFEFDITDEYIIDKNGEVINEKRGFLSKIFKRSRWA